ncbi:MAG: endo alpha-1,4 polygalactosaminidase [Spirochaetales bacterium]|nr:endo alpha-1,4 polygalactosaminidase [Spirochaetales bacterium]
MKKIILFMTAIIFLSSCGTLSEEVDYRQEMRKLVIGISEYAKNIHPGFYIIPQNGIELVSENGEPEGPLNDAYLAAIDGNGQEDLFYGYNRDDEPTPVEENTYLTALLDVSLNAGNTILVTDYCSTPAYMDGSYSSNNDSGYISFAADQRDLYNIPVYPASPYGENDLDITTLAAARNFLYLINPEEYSSKTEFINSIIATNYDLLIMDLFFNDDTPFTAGEVMQLKTKANGGTRLVICYMSIGEAEDYRYYWLDDWDRDEPSWLEEENPEWEGNYKVKYWDSLWQGIIFGSSTSYLGKILDAGFDGVYLDIIDGFEYFE